jgi:hypothetical protein
MLLLIDTFSINKGRGYENPSLEIIVTERCSTGGCPLEEACEHCYLNQSAISAAISYIISVYGEDYAGYFTVILSFLVFHFCSAYFIYLVSCIPKCHQIFIIDILRISKIFQGFYTSRYVWILKIFHASMRTIGIIRTHEP